MARESVPDPSNASMEAGSPDDLFIEPWGGHGVIIRKEYSHHRRRTDFRILTASCLILGLVPSIVFTLYKGGQVDGFWLMPAVIIPVTLAYHMFRQFSALTRSCVIMADRTGLSVDVTTWRQRTTHQLPRTHVTDVVLDCSGGPDGRHVLFRSYLLIRTSTHGDIHCLHNISGDRLARAANALRAALGLPARSWP